MCIDRNGKSEATCNCWNWSFQLFVRAYTADGGSKSILVDEKMTVAQVCDILVAKNHVTPTVHWAVIEQLPELYMGE